MLSQRFKWNLPDQISAQLSQQLESYPVILRNILFQRNIVNEQDAIDYLLPKNKDWYSSIKPLHAEKSCQLINKAIESDDMIAIYGDYDADGLTSAALLYSALSKVTDNLITYIPNRFTEGYGLNKTAISDLRKKNTALLITVDNGIRSFDEIEYANSLGMSVLVTDHHTPKKELPPAAAIMNPKIRDDPYPSKNLAGVGISYKLIASLKDQYPSIIPEDYLDLVAIGTIADIVPLIGENRYLVKQGLITINQYKRQSLVSLLGVSNLLNRKIRSTDISYQLAPRLNAPGRIGSADKALKLLIASDPKICGSLAQQLENDNYNRKKISRLMIQKAQKIILGADPPGFLLSVFDEDFHSGVSGIVAGSLARKYYLPVFVGQIGKEYTVASCRSIPEFNLIQALDQCKDLFVRYGGHSQAAGFTILNDNLPDLIERSSQIADKELSGFELKPSIDIDTEVTLDQLNNNLYELLMKLEPTGASNSEVVFLGRNLGASRIKTVGQEKEHIKMSLTDGMHSIEAIGFGLGDLIDYLPPKFDALFNFQINDYKGKSSFQLNLLDIREC